VLTSIGKCTRALTFEKSCQLQRGDHGPPPATPLIETSNFEGERPFTQQRRKAPLRAPGGLGGSSSGALHGTLGGGGLGGLGGSVGGLGGSGGGGGGGQHGADVLTLDDDDARDPVAHAPSQRPSSRSGRTGTAALKEREREKDDEGGGAGGAHSRSTLCRDFILYTY
jgi:hypothetical protein